METDSENRARDLVDALFSLPFYLGGFLTGFALVILYVILAEWSYPFAMEPMVHAVFWLPSGLTVFLFFFFKSQPRILPFLLGGLFIGEVFVVHRHEGGAATAILWGLSNQVLAGMAYLVAKKLLPPDFTFRRVKDVLTFLLLAPLMTIPGGLLGGLGSFLRSGTEGYLNSTTSWVLSDTLGIIFAAPVLFSWSEVSTQPRGSRQEGVILALHLLIFSAVIFYYPERTIVDRSYFSFLTFFAAWGAIRFGVRGASLVLLLIDLVEVGATMQGWGTFANNDLPPHERLFTLQLLVANLSILMLILAAALEEQFILTKKAETATRVRDDFISVASHELKTPLTGLTMEIQILNNYIRSGAIKDVPVEKLNRLANISESEVRRFGGLVNDLLDVSRITSGKMVLQKEECDLLKLVHEGVNRLRPELESSGSILTVTGKENLRGLWDPRRIGQVITNLISNAIKYGNGLPIIIEVTEDEGRAIFCIHDQGVGVSIEDQKRIFERFERAVSAKEYSGLGLGLFIAREIVEVHGGKISVTSGLEKGTVFRVELPLTIGRGEVHPYWKDLPPTHGRIFY